MKGLILEVLLLFLFLKHVILEPVGNCPSPDPLNRTEHLPDDKDCTTFWRCDHETPKQETCPDKLHFNPTLQVCDWPSNAGCESGSSETSTTRSPKPEPTTSAATTTQPSTSKSSTSAAPTTRPPKPGPSTPAVTTSRPPTSEPTTSAATSTRPPTPESSSTAATTVRPSIDVTCENATEDRWHLPHPTNCSKFYKCDLNTGKATQFECPDNLHFNPQAQVCDWPQQAGCESGSVGSTTEHPPAPEATTSAVTTAHPPTSESSTSAGTTTRPSKPEPTTPTVTTSRPPTSGPTTSAATTTHPPAPELSTSAATTTRPPKPEPTTSAATSTQPPTAESSTTAATTVRPPIDVTCENATEDRWHLPHPTNCSKFYKCDLNTGKATQFECPDNLHFNPQAQVCDWPQQAGCESGSVGSTTARPPTPEATTSAATTTRPPTSEHSTSAATTTYPSTSESSISDATTTRPPKPELTTPAVITSRPPTSEPSTSAPTTTRPPTSETTTSAATTTHPPTREPSTSASTTTRHPKPKPTTPAVTTSRPPTSEPTTSAATSTRPSTPESSSTAATTVRPPIDVNCENATEDRWHLPHPTDCTKFYKCDLNTGKATPFECPDNLHFNPQAQVCDWPQQAGCESGSVGSTTARPLTPEGTTSAATTTRPSTPEPSTSAATTARPPTPEVSTTAATTVRPPKESICENATDDRWHLPHPTDCSKFYKCDLNTGKATEFDCPDNLHFNPQAQVCDWPQQAGCESGSLGSSTASPSASEPTTAEASTTRPTTPEPTTPAPSTTRPTTPEISTSAATTARPSTSETTIAIVTTVRPPPADSVCQNATEDRWHLPHPTDCTKFFKCDLNTGRGTEFVCPDGLHFNSQAQVCDWQSYAGCESGSV